MTWNMTVAYNLICDVFFHRFSLHWLNSSLNFQWLQEQLSLESFLILISHRLVWPPSDFLQQFVGQYHIYLTLQEPGSSLASSASQRRTIEDLLTGPTPPCQVWHFLWVLINVGQFFQVLFCQKTVRPELMRLVPPLFLRWIKFALIGAMFWLIMFSAQLPYFHSTLSFQGGWDDLARPCWLLPHHIWIWS